MRLPRVLLFAALAAALLLPCGSAHAQDDPLASISAERYIVIDAETGEIFAEQNADVRGGMASLTKIFTVMEAIERAPLDTPITAEESDLFGPDSTTMTGFTPGVTFTLNDLLHGMILESGNDAAVAVARSLGAGPGDDVDESEARFVGWMNERVQSLGLTDTRLQNPHGLSDDDHYSTPRDIAAFLMYALTNPAFVDVLTADSYVTSTGVEIRSINRGPEFIADYIGGKTGFDEKTGYCLAEVADRDGVTMIAVTIDGAAPDTWYIDHATLFDVGYAGLDDRLAANQPLPDNRVAFVAPGQAAEVGDSEQAPGSNVAAEQAPVESGQQPAVPTPVRVDALPQPSANVRDSRSITGNWILPSAVLVGLITLLGIRQLGHLQPASRGPRPVDTSGRAS